MLGKFSLCLTRVNSVALFNRTFLVGQTCMLFVVGSLILSLLLALSLAPLGLAMCFLNRSRPASYYAKASTHTHWHSSVILIPLVHAIEHCAVRIALNSSNTNNNLRMFQWVYLPFVSARSPIVSLFSSIYPCRSS